MKLSIKGLGIIAAIVLALFALSIGIGRLLKGNAGQKPMSGKEAESVVLQELKKVTGELGVYKQAVYAQSGTIAELAKKYGETSKALMAVQKAMQRHDALRGTTYIESFTKIDSAIATLQPGHDSLTIAIILDSLAKMSSNIRNGKPPELTWSNTNQWIDQTFTYDPIEKAGVFGLMVRNQFTVNKYEENGKLMVEVLNGNPFTTTEEGTNHFEIASPTNVSVKKKRFGIGVHAGGGIDKNFKPIPYVGVGLSYNLWNF